MILMAVARWPAIEGEMSERIRSFDWSTTPLGPIDTWPPQLCTVVELMLATPHGVSIAWGPDLTLLYNDELISILGCKHPHALGRPYSEVWAEVWREYGPLIEGTMRGESHCFLDQPIAIAGRPGVPMGWFTFSYSSLRDAEGAVAGFYCDVVETTEKVRAVDALRKANEMALHRSEQRYRRLFNSIDEGFATVEVLFDRDERPTDFRYVETNAMFERQTGIADALGRTIRELVPRIEQHWIYTLGAVAMTGEPKRFTGYAAALGRWFDVYGFRVDEPSDRHVAVVFRDVTESKEAEERLRNALQIKTVGVLFWGPDFRLADMNEAFLEMSGFTREEALGRGWEDFTPREFHELSSNAIREIQTRGESTPYEKQYFRKDGSRWWGLFAARRIGRETVEYVLDVSERHQAEEALRAADRRKDEFLATLAHELRNPLAAIAAAVQLLNRQSHNPEVVALARASLERQIDHMARLLDDLLDLARITHGRVQLRLDTIDVVESVRAAADTVRPQFDAKRQLFGLHLPLEPVYVRADSVRLTQIIGNLLNNAAKYTSEGGQIELTLTVNEGRAVISVADNGIGIDPSMLERVFEMFSQGRQVPQAPNAGLGIGLALVKGLVTLHNGTIEAHSEGEGRGSEFIVKLPLAEHARQAPRVGRPTAEANEHEALRILIADDNVDSATSWAMLLAQDGDEVRTAYDGKAALEEAERFKPDVALLDIGLPLLDGYQIARRIRATDWGADAMLVAITGWGQARDRERARDAGFDHHFTKPASIRDVEAVLEEARNRVTH
jgi:PAS domain S-box-containing protein